MFSYIKQKNKKVFSHIIIICMHLRKIKNMFIINKVKFKKLNWYLTEGNYQL